MFVGAVIFWCLHVRLLEHMPILHFPNYRMIGECDSIATQATMYFCLISLTLLHGACGVQDEFIRFINDGWSRGKAGYNAGAHQHNATPQPQGLMPSPTSWNYDPGSSVGRAGDHLRQPTATSSVFPHLATRWSDDESPSQAHLPNVATQRGYCHSSGNPYQFTQQPANHFDRLSSYALDLGSAHMGLPQATRETLDMIGSVLMEEGDPPLVTTTDVLSRASTSVAPVLDLSHSTSFPSWIPHFPELQDVLDIGGDVTRHPRETSTASSIGELSKAVADSESRKGFQEFSMIGSKRMRGPSPVLLHQQPRDKLIRYDIDRLSPTDLNIHRSHSELGSFSSTPSTLGHIDVPSIESEFVGFSQEACRQRFTPGALSPSKIRVSAYVHIIRSATGVQRKNQQRKILLSKSVAKWLPVYAVAFKPKSQSLQMEAKLAILFEHLWLINTWLLCSFDADNIKEKMHYCAQDDMMTWVVSNLLSNLPGLTFASPESREFDELQRHISKYLIACRDTTKIRVAVRRGRCPHEVETENILACEAAFYILEAYHQTTNWERYQKAFSLYGGIYARLKAYTISKIYGHTPQWKNTKKAMYGQISMAPWSAKENQKKVTPAILNTHLKEKLEQICLRRLQEIQNESDMKKYWIKKYREDDTKSE